MFERGTPMKDWLVSKLICPACPVAQAPLELVVRDARLNDVWDGELNCTTCGNRYPIQQGVAVLLPSKMFSILDDKGGYNTPGMLSAYLWSHFCDLVDDPGATDAYRHWMAHLQPSDGDALDVGCAVGRLSFELARTHSRVVGIDISMPFSRKAREILLNRRLDFKLIVEGHVTETRRFDFDEQWDFDHIDFIVADALALPFRQHEFSTVAAINILEKVPDPIKHLMEVNRMLARNRSSFLFSDPFSWDETSSPKERWLGGNGNDRYCARGIDTLRQMFAGEHGVFDPPLAIEGCGDINWKIRKTENLWEHITSQFLVGRRS